MDYDENDFQGQNLHLTGEGSSKFSPVLRPFALPKFDFDDILQGQLRFDSLVENEVFLGIPSQEDNQWIEDFSQGSSEIEFSSSAAESCSISRRNNVWSEATSSESVEMLLKSVGQEEMVPGETVIEESDAGNKLRNLTKQMDPNSKRDDRMEDVKDSVPALPPDQILRNFSRRNESAEDVHPHVNCTSKTQGCELSAYVTSGELDPNAVGRKCVGFVNNENLGIERKFNDANQGEAGTSVNEFLNNRRHEDITVSGIQTDKIDSSHNVIASAGGLSDKEIPHQVSDICFESAIGLAKDIHKGVGEHSIQGTAFDDQSLTGSAAKTCTSKLDNYHCVASKLESIEEHAVAIGFSIFEKPPSLEPKGDSDLHVGEGCSGDVLKDPVHGSMCEVVICSEGIESKRQLKDNTLHVESPVTFQGGENFEGHVVEVSNTVAGVSSNPELKTGSVTVTEITLGHSSDIEENKIFLGSDGQMYVGASVSSSEASVMLGVDNKSSIKGDRSSINNTSDLASLMVASSSAELLGGKPSTENLSDGDNASEVHEEDKMAVDKIFPCLLPESMRICKESLSSDQGDVHNCDQDVPFLEKGTAKLPVDSSNMECEIVGSLDIDKRDVSSVFGEVSKENVERPYGPEVNTTIRTESATLDVDVEDTELAPCDTLGGVPSNSGDGATVAEVIDHNEEQKSPLIDKEKYVEVHAEASLSSVKDDSQIVTELDSISEVEKGASCDGVANKLHEMVDRAVLVVETYDTTTQSERVVVANEVSQECSKNLEVHPVFGDSTVKECDATEAASLEHQKETTLEQNHEAASLKLTVDTSNDDQASFDLARSSEYDANCTLGGGSSAEPDKLSCGSATVITYTELPQSEKDNQEDAKGAVVENIPLSEVNDGVDGKVTPMSMNSTGIDASKEDRSFTFDVSPLAGLLEGETGKDWQPFPVTEACKISTVVDGFPSTSCGSQMNPRMVQESYRGSPQASDGRIVRVGAKATPERKTRRGSGKTGKESTRKGNHVKETTPVRHIESGDKPCVPMSPCGTGQFVHFEELKSYGSVERGGVKPCGVVSIPTSNLPDLNTSALHSVLFQQPFTDLQQVQLRAQIFVYGSLIQGATPDEACMASAFGPSVSGRNVWEPAWHALVERLHGQKSLVNNSETPMQSCSGAKAPEQASKQGVLQSKVLSPPVGRVSSKGTPLPVVNPMIPLSLPLWNISTPPHDGLQSSGMPRGPHVEYHQALSPMHLYQSPPIQNFVGRTTSWLSQAPFPGPWVTSPQTSAFNIGARLSALPTTETVKLTPVKESSVPNSSGTKHAFPISVAQSGGPSILAGAASLLDMKKVTVSDDKHSTDPKARKRKKVPITEDVGQISLPAQTQSESVSASVVSSHLSRKVPVSEDIGHISTLAQIQIEPVSATVVSTQFSTSVAVTTPACFVSKGNSRKFLRVASSTSSTDQSGDQNVEKKIVISEETLSKVEEAKLQAEAAATHAAIAVSHCHGVWSQLDKEKDSELISHVEANLASAAVAIAAAAAVAKAAAAAANIASKAAMQAKEMADEALASSETCNSTQSSAISPPNTANNLGKTTPASILKGVDGSNCSSSIIFAAREVARRRVDAALSASKHAENLDAIVKAAELAAEAVSQAGQIVAMRDPLPLKELVEAGPESYWKITQVPSEQGVRSNDVDGDKSKINNIEEVHNVFTKQLEGPCDKDKQTPNRHVMSPLSREISREMMEDKMKVVNGISGSVTHIEKDSRGQMRRSSDLAKTIGVVPESEIGSRSNFVSAQDDYGNVAGALNENNIKEGSLVEVFKDGGDFKAAWFSANALSLEDGKVFVCYTKLQSDEGSGQLKEWVPLESEGSKAPIVRFAHPVTTMQFEGTRKRRRVAMKDYAWSVGDKVDAWMQDSWREGVVTEKNKKDETTLTIHFPAQGETSVVRAWHLRPTVIWKDGQWIEWSREDFSSQGDTPQEKRLKLSNPAIEGIAMDKMSKNMDLVGSGKHDGTRLLPLSADEHTFNVGKNTRDENRPDGLRTTRTGLQKEGSRVVFGVPKPGKKRKFMEVSKQYVSGRSTKDNAANDSVKFEKFLMPQGSGSHVWKYNSKTDSKEKGAADSKPRVLKSGKPPIVPARTLLTQKGNLLTSTVSSPSDATMIDHVVKDSISNYKNEPGQQNQLGFVSFLNTEGAAEGPILFTSLALPPDAPSKKVSISNTKSERLNKGKLAPASGTTVKIGAKDKSIPEVVEPRRSNRRIQPTSRLLEGLQSSLIISKIPSVSHDRSQRSQSRGMFKRE